MHEERKLKEAWFFLGEMNARERDPHALIHLLSAFLSAARSVAQYTHNEATAKAGGQAWYDGEIKKHSLINFFKDERDVNIHTKPVDPKAVWKTAAFVPMFISGGADYRFTFRDEKGQPVEIEHTVAPAKPSPPPTPQQGPEVVRYEFADRPNQSILTLCESYLKELESLVGEGRNAGFLTP